MTDYKIERLEKMVEQINENLDGKIADLNEQIESIKRKQYSLITDKAWTLDSMYNEKVDTLESVLKEHLTSHKWTDDRTGEDSDKGWFKKVNDAINKQLEMLGGEKERVYSNKTLVKYVDDPECESCGNEIHPLLKHNGRMLCPFCVAESGDIDLVVEKLVILSREELDFLLNHWETIGIPSKAETKMLEQIKKKVEK